MEVHACQNGSACIGRARAAGVHHGAGRLARFAPAAQGGRRRHLLGLPGRPQQLRARRCAEEAGQGGLARLLGRRRGYRLLLACNTPQH